MPRRNRRVSAGHGADGTTVALHSRSRSLRGFERFATDVLLFRLLFAASLPEIAIDDLLMYFRHVQNCLIRFVVGCDYFIDRV